MPANTTQALEPEREEEESAPYAICENCEGEIEDDDGVHSVVTGRNGWRAVRQTWCEACYGHAIYVEDLEETVSPDYAYERLYCWESDGAYHTEPEECEALYSYGTNVITVHGWPSRTKRDSLCFGVELEMESEGEDCFDSMLTILGSRDGNGRYILKSDGSLDDNCGAELVTLPYSLEDHQGYFRWDKILSDGLRNVAKSGAGTPNCGMHVHVNRRALSSLTIGKMLVFLNHKSNDAFVSLIAQRKSSHFCERDRSKNKVTAVHDGQERYDILNILGPATIEFRMFRGNLRPERVLKNIEFCHALIRWCETISIMGCADGDSLVKFIQANAKAYPHLTAFLTERRWIKSPHERSRSKCATLARADLEEA